MKKVLLSLTATLVLGASASASDNLAKGLNVMITSADTQTQMMGMVLSTMTLKEKKEVNMVLCSDAGNLALKDFEAGKIKMQGEEKTPKMLLQGLIKEGANVEVCPLFLPNAGKTEADLMEGVSVAKPPMVAKKLLDKDLQTLSY
jgi:predicted peroxiredoxin